MLERLSVAFLVCSACGVSQMAAPAMMMLQTPGDSGSAAPSPDAGTTAMPAPDAGAVADAGHTADAGYDCTHPGPDWVFCSGFEEGNKAIWDDYDGNPDSTNLLMLDPGPRNDPANHIMRIRVPPGRGNADLVKVLPPHDTLYARWYMKWEVGYDFTAPNHGSGLHAGARDFLGNSGNRPTGDDWFSSWIEPSTTSPHNLRAYTYYRGMYQDCADPNGQCWGDAFPCDYDDGQVYCTKPADRPMVMETVVTSGVWYCIEQKMTAGAATPTAVGAQGSLDTWIDGVEQGPWDGLWLRTSSSVQPDLLWLNLFFHMDHSVEGIMFDDVVVSTSRVGCL